MLSFPPEITKIALAVSGGVDSMVLMDCARTLKDKYEIHIFTVNHNFRKESADEVKIIAKVAEDFGFTPHIFTITDEKPKASAQEFAREKRYEFFSQKSRELGIELVCIAHHKDDIYETLLSRLSHKSGLYGLSVMPKYFYHQGVNFYRPFLDFTKKEIEAYALKNQVLILEDPSNQTKIYERNKWRFFLKDNFELLPKLESIYRKAKTLRYDLQIERDDHIKNHVYLSPLGYVIIQREEISDEIMLLVLRYGIMFVSGEAYISLEKIPEKNININHTHIHVTKKQFILYRENRNLPIEKNTGDILDKRFKINNKPQGKLLMTPQSVKEFPLKLKIPLPFLETETGERVGYEALSWEYLPQGLESFNSDIMLHHK